MAMLAAWVERFVELTQAWLTEHADSHADLDLSSLQNMLLKLFANEASDCHGQGL